MGRVVSAAGTAVVVACILGSTGCAPGPKEPVQKTIEQGAEQTQKLKVAAVNYPLAYFAQRLGGDGIEVHFPIPGDVDPAEWQPDAEAVIELQKADLILLNGAGYANWLNSVTLPQKALLNTSAQIEGRLVQEEGNVTHSHGPGGEHEHGGLAFTTWLDPQLAAFQASAVRDALVAAQPNREAGIIAAFEDLRKDLATLDDRLATAVSQDPKRPVIFSHPVYQYLTARYEIVSSSLHWEPDEIPAEKQWKKLAHLVDHEPSGWMLWESEPLPEVVSRLDEMGIRCVVFDPCSNIPETGDFLTVMTANAAALEMVFSSD